MAMSRGKGESEPMTLGNALAAHLCEGRSGDLRHGCARSRWQPAIDAIGDLDPSAYILTLFPKHRDTAGMLPYLGNALGKPFTASELLAKVRRSLVGLGPRSP
jgi:hypothetical protein